MNKQLTLLFLLLISVITISAAQVGEEEKAMSQGINNAITVDISDVNGKTAENVWKDLMKQYKGKVKKNRKSDEWTTTNIKIASIAGSEPLTIYAQVEETGKDVELSMWIPMSEGGYLSASSHPDEYKSAEILLKDYALDVRIETVKAELKEEEKNLSKQEKELRKLQKDKEGYHKDIKNAEIRIEDSEDGLRQNVEDQKEAVQQVRLMEDVFTERKDTLEVELSNVTSKEERKRINKLIKSEEKKVKGAKDVQKKAEQEEKKLRKILENSKQTIKESNEKIVTNERDQQAKQVEIDKQKKIIEGVDNRLKRLYDYK